MQITLPSKAEWADLWKQPSWKSGAWHSVVKKAASQEGLLTRAQVTACGFTAADWKRIERFGWVLPHSRGVYEIFPPDGWFERQLHAAKLSLGDDAVASHRAAARLFRLWGINGNPLEFSADSRREIRGVIVHRRTVPETDVIWLRGVRTTSLARTLVDLSEILDDDSLAVAFEMARRRQPKIGEQLETRLGNEPGRVAPALLELVAEAKARKVLLQSPPEVWAWRWMRDAHLELPQPQYVVPGLSGAPITVDFGYAEEKVAIEILGFGYHGSKDRFEKDAKRATRLSKAGWIVIYVTYERLVDGFQSVLTEIRMTLARQRARARGH